MKIKKYTFKEAFDASLVYFGGDELAANVWVTKYALKNSDGSFAEQTPEDMHKRMALEFGAIEDNYEDIQHVGLSIYGKKRTKLTTEKIFDYFNQFKYITPQGSILSMLGNKTAIGSLSNCVVLPKLFDSYGGILYADQQLAQLFKRRAGAGMDISTLRPNNSSVTNAAETTTGAVSFMHRFSNTTREVGQSGRRGALMISMDVRHPDILDFVAIKRDLTKVTGANISINLRDDFMRAVTANEKYVLRFPVDAEVKDALFVKEINAVDLWNEIIISAHGYGEPGIMFKDRQHKYSTSSVYPNWTNIGTNPCSEIGMNDDSCRLMLVNYLSCVENPFTSEAIFNFEKLYEITYEAQRLLDDLVDLELIAVSKILIKIENDPEPDFIKSVEKETWVNLYNKGKAGRRTGLGFTALADTFAAMGFKYDSKEAMNLLKAISETKFKAEFDSSIDMAIQRGKFDDFDPKYENTSEFVIMMQNEYPELYNRMMKYGRRNISISTVAPAGSMSILLQTSSGIEPLYKIGYKRRKKINPSDKNVVVNFVDSMGDSWTEYDILHHGVTQWMKINNIVDVTLANQQSPYAGSTASEIDWVKRIELQALVQKYVTHSISSTINLPENVSLERVGEIYLEAWKQGLKGITVYREGSRSGVLISMDKSKELVDSEAETHAVRRPQSVDCDVIRFMNSSEKWIAFLGIVKGRPYEIFTGLAEDFPIPSFVEKGKVRRVKDNGKGSRYDFLYTDKAGYEQEIKGLNRTFNKVFWNYAKLISGLLRNRMHLLSLIHTLETLTTDNDNINTWMNGVVRILRKYIKDGTKDSKEGNCPNCGAVLQYSEGCLKCFACSFSKCG